MPISREEKNRRRREQRARDRARDRRVIERADFLRDLLKEFDARLFAFDPGVVFTVSGDISWNRTISMDGDQWNWLEPLLVELRERRKSEGN